MRAPLTLLRDGARATVSEGRAMDAGYISALAALAGSTIGGLTSLAASWLTQRVQFNAQQVAHTIGRREELYNDFIDRASECYADAFEHSEADVPKIVRLYALVSRMRVVSSAPTTEQADKVVQLIIKTYDAPNKTFHETFHELARDVRTPELDPLRDFSEACRQELRAAAPIATLS